MSRFTRISYTAVPGATAELIYVEEPLQSADLHAVRVMVLDDGLRLDELPEDAHPLCPDQLPQGAWADYDDPAERDYADHESAQWVRSLTE